jgi:hypothetical protein
VTSPTKLCRRLSHVLLTDFKYRSQTEESWVTYESYMIHKDTEKLEPLSSNIEAEDYLDKMSAPRIDPARPDLTGWAMKENRRRQREGESNQ